MKIEKKSLARNRFSSVEEALEVLNGELLRRARSKGVLVGPISIEGVGGNDAAKIRAIQDQYRGLVRRLTVPSKRLGGG